MKLGIVGSRRRNKPKDWQQVVTTIDLARAKYGDDLVVVSGGCKKGADHFAACYCRTERIKLIEHLPDLSGAKGYNQIVQRYYARNRKIADGCDILVAFVANDRKGGTENTIKWAKSFGKDIVLL